jgi:hypothetical protein
VQSALDGVPTITQLQVALAASRNEASRRKAKVLHLQQRGTSATFAATVASTSADSRPATPHHAADQALKAQVDRVTAELEAAQRNRQCEIERLQAEHGKEVQAHKDAIAQLEQRVTAGRAHQSMADKQIAANKKLTATAQANAQKAAQQLAQERAKCAEQAEIIAQLHDVTAAAQNELADAQVAHAAEIGAVQSRLQKAETKAVRLQQILHQRRNAAEQVRLPLAAL